MAFSNVEICNIALTALGANNITALTENTEEARKCNVLFDNLRDEMIESHLWNFAIRRTGQLALSATSPEWEYANKFQLPVDCLRVLKTNFESAILGPNRVNDRGWKVEEGFLVTDESDVKIQYIASVTDPNQQLRSFQMALAARLEAELAFSILQSATIAKAKWELYQLKLRTARAVDAQEGVPDDVMADEWTNSRYTNTTGWISLENP
jgi:hypothetical protein